MTHLSLCSGIGGLDLAAEWAGFETIAQCEIDEYASKVLAKNFPGVVNLHDIRTVDARLLAEHGIGQPTVISAGFPCQPYSLAGKGRGDRDERDLWGEVARVLGEIKPRWFVGENTPGLFARSNQRFFRRVLDDLTALGYSVGWGMWGACDVGAPHKRDRVFIIANRNISDANISDAVIERCDSDEIQRGEFAKSRDAKNAWRIQESRMQFERVCGSVPHAAGDELGLYGSASETQRIRTKRDNNGNRTQRYASGEWWQVESDVGRVVTRVPARVDRLRCLGNAVVPQQAYPIFRAIAEYEEKVKR